MVNPKLLFPVIALAVCLVVVAVLWDVVPQSYSEHQTITLSFQQSPPWRSSICIPGTTSGSLNYTNVSFTWATNNSAVVDLVVWPSGNNPGQFVYNVTASSGSGWYSSQGTEYFAVFGTPSLSTVVTVSLSYTLPGHVLGGSIVNPTC